MMRKLAFVLAISAICGAFCTVNAGGESVNKAPNVIPALRQWQGTSGYYYVTDSTKVVLEYDSIINEAQKTIVSEYFKNVTGFDVEITVGIPVDGDVYFERSDDKSLGDEGYIIDAEDIITVSAQSAKGLIYGVTTLLQSIKADGYMPKGSARDVPEYRIRSVMIDVGRAYVPLEYVEEITEYLAWFKMNEIHLHINDDGSDGVGYFRLESDVPNLTSEQYYKKSDYRDYQKRALEYGIEVVTEIDTPAHSRSFARAVPELMLNANHLDISKNETVRFIENLFDEYITGDNPVFVSRTVHIGTDEYPAGYDEYMRAYTDTLIKHVSSRGYTARFWGSFGGDGFNGITPVTGNAQANYWAVALSDYNVLLDMGYDLINTCGPVLYCVPGGNYGFADYYDLSRLYKTWYVNYLGNSSASAINAHHPQLLGACSALWNDLWCDWGGYSVFDLFDRIRYQVCLISEKTWCGEQTKNISADDFIARFNVLSLVAGGSNPGRHVSLPVTAENSGDIKSIGFPYICSADISAKSYNTDIFSGVDGRLYITAGGKIAFQRESYTFTFNCDIPKDKTVNIKLYSDNKKSLLIVDDTWFYDPVNSRNDNALKGSSTFVLPIEKIGSENCKVDNFTVEEISFNPTDYLHNRNIALNKTVTVSGLEVDYGLNEPLAVDGDMNTRLSFARDKDEQWMITDLGSVSTVNKVIIRYFERVPAFELYVSENGTDYTKVYEKSGLEEGTSNVAEIAEFTPVKARYIKYVQLKRWYCVPYSTYYSGGINEFEVYGSEPDFSALLEEAEKIKDKNVQSAVKNINNYLKSKNVYLPHMEALIEQLQAAVDGYKNQDLSEESTMSESENTLSNEVSSVAEPKKTNSALPWIIGAALAAVGLAVVVIIKKRNSRK